MNMVTTKPALRPAGSDSIRPRRDYLKEIRTNVERRPVAICPYGVAGIGKTSLVASIPGVIVLHTADEDGITTLKTYGQVPQSVPQMPPVTNWLDCLDMLDWLATAEHGYKVLALDAMGGFERLCHDEVCRRDYRGDWGTHGFLHYHKGYETALTDWRLFLAALDRLRDERGMSVMLLAHSQIETFSNPEAEDYDRYTPAVHKKTWAVTSKWLDVVLFLNYVVVVDSDGKAQGGQERVMFTQYHPAYEAKNRLGLPSEISMGTSGAEAWSNLSTAVKAGKAGA
jgi:hypothetical protein